MARIRTIKPEFADSESLSRVSRDARLLFVILWTLADDAGRLRGQSRWVAAQAFPYDDDAPDLIAVWLDELEREGCIVRYDAAGSSYIAIANWAAHQLISKPAPSRIPEPPQDSPGFPRNPQESPGIPSPRARADLDQDQEGIKDQYQDQGVCVADAGARTPAREAPPDDPSADTHTRPPPAARGRTVAKRGPADEILEELCAAGRLEYPPDTHTAEVLEPLAAKLLAAGKGRTEVRTHLAGWWDRKRRSKNGREPDPPTPQQIATHVGELFARPPPSVREVYAQPGVEV